MGRSRRIARRWGILGIGLVLAGGCEAVIGLEDWKKPIPSDGAGGAAGGGAGGSGSSGQGGAPACASCVAEPPVDWMGPVAFFAGDVASPDCPAQWALAWDAGNGAVLPPVTCAPCTCEFTGATCSATSVKLFTDASCTAGESQPIQGGAMCSQVMGMTTADTFQSAQALPILGNGGQCTPSGGDVTARPGLARADVVVIDPERLKSGLGEPIELVDPRLGGTMRMVKRTDGVVRTVVIGGRIAFDDGTFAPGYGETRFGRLLRAKHRT